MEQIGFSVVDAQGNELQYWGDTLGAMTKPDRVVWPNGDITEAFNAAPIENGEWKVVPRYGKRGNAQIEWDGQRVIKSFPVLAQDIKSEAQRRIISLVGAPDINACIIKQLNALMRATELSNKKHAAALTEQEQSEAATLQNMADWIKFIRARSNELEMTLPADYTNDIHWS